MIVMMGVCVGGIAGVAFSELGLKAWAACAVAILFGAIAAYATYSLGMPSVQVP